MALWMETGEPQLSFTAIGRIHAILISPKSQNTLRKAEKNGFPEK
jgi:hypothetical protein